MGKQAAPAGQAVFLELPVMHATPLMRSREGHWSQTPCCSLCWKDTRVLCGNQVSQVSILSGLPCGA